jgi:hypothetical protein
LVRHIPRRLRGSDSGSPSARAFSGAATPRHRTYRRLTAKDVAEKAARRAAGMYPDGDGLYLSISRAAVASWTYRFMFAGKSHEMGLGPYRDINLSQARQRAPEARDLKRRGVDPLAARRAGQQAAAVRKAKTITFEACAQAYIQAHRAGWKSAVHAKQWANTLDRYAHPVFGAVPVDAIDTGLVRRVLAVGQHRPEENSAAQLQRAGAPGHPLDSRQAVLAGEPRRRIGRRVHAGIGTRRLEAASARRQQHHRSATGPPRAPLAAPNAG